MSGVDVLRWATQVAFVALAVAALREVRRRGTPADDWMAATTSCFAIVIIGAIALPDDPTSTAGEAAGRALIAVLALFPYFLFRFATAFKAGGRMPAWVPAVLTGALVVWTAFVDLPSEGETRSAAETAWLIYFLAVWTALSIVVARRLWRAGAGEHRVARRRMRLLGAAAVVLAAALVLSGTAGGGEDDAVAAVVQLGALASASLFYVAYAPPTLVRTWWRRREADALRQAELELLATSTPEEVAAVLLPRASALLGAKGASFVAEGEVRPQEGDDVTVVVPMRAGELIVETSEYAPVFGDEELKLLTSLALVADLATERNLLLVSERDARREAERMSADLEQFAYAASHDLQEPLRLMSSFARLLERRYGEQFDDEGRELLDAIGRSSERAQELIRDLLELSKVGRQEMELARENFAEVVREALTTLAATIEESGAEVAIDPLPEATFDRRLMSLVFQNLIGNAIKYSRPDEPPRVHIRGERTNTSVAVAVSDNGEGIDPSSYERIFAPFERLHGGDGPPGTGIGLAIVKKVVEMHDGAVSVTSTPGRGTTFTVVVPADPPPDEPPALVPAASAGM